MPTIATLQYIGDKDYSCKEDIRERIQQHPPANQWRDSVSNSVSNVGRLCRLLGRWWLQIPGASPLSTDTLWPICKVLVRRFFNYSVSLFSHQQKGFGVQKDKDMMHH